MSTYYNEGIQIVKVHVFWFGHFPRYKINSESSFLIKSYLYTVSYKALYNYRFLIKSHMIKYLKKNLE